MVDVPSFLALLIIFFFAFGWIGIMRIIKRRERKRMLRDQEEMKDLVASLQDGTVADGVRAVQEAQRIVRGK